MEDWICCQLGAREHYAIPRALSQSGELALLVTDAWADTILPWKVVPGSRARERFHPDVPSRIVRSFDWSLLTFEISGRRMANGWARTVARNDWFQNHVVNALKTFRSRHPNHSCTFFSYSYTARKPFEFAKDAGWFTVLGQIDPGPYEENLVGKLRLPNGCSTSTTPAPAEYWDNWRDECRMADRILVNSEWARKGLCSEGIPREKLRIVPLVYEPPVDASSFDRSYPAAFDANRPLRVLFLGQICLRKGAAEILAAVSQLENAPVEFWMVGPVQLELMPQYREHRQIRWMGAVPRSDAASYYRDADVFLFPTFSDGFGLTQLEAQAWRLPVIASSHCGDVVRHLENGYLLPEVSAQAIVETIRTILAWPNELSRLAKQSRSRDFTPGRLPGALADLRQGI